MGVGLRCNAPFQLLGWSVPAGNNVTNVEPDEQAFPDKINGKYAPGR